MLLGSCVSKNKNCNVTPDDILNKYSNKVYIIYKKDGTIMAISDSGINKFNRGVYYFSDKGVLKSYKYFKDTIAYSYNEEYDEAGQLTRHEGAVLVDRTINEINIDSAFITASFFSLHKTYRNLSVLINDSLKLELPLKDDSLFSNIKTASFGFNTHNLRQIKILFSIPYVNACTGKDTIIVDTTNLVKNPRLNLVENLR